METKSSVDWFYEALDQLVEDDELEAAGKTIELFFDTADVYDALRGMLAFYTPEFEFDLREFHQRCTLVRCLAARGWLGPFQMLPPHQVEFLTLLQLDMTAPLGDIHSLAREFLKKVRSTQGTTIRGTGDDGTLDAVTLSEDIRRQAGSATTFFKAIECIRGTWQQRLARWRRSERLRIIADDLDYSVLLQSDLFADLKDALDDKRPGRASNNFADAAAIAVLVERIRQYVDKKSDKIPRFFASRQLFHYALEAAGAIPLLTYQTARGSTSSALRDAEYFLVRSVFRPPPQLRRELGIEPVPAADLRAIHSHLAQIREASGELTESALSALELGGRPLRDVIRDLRQLTFLESVWLPELAVQDVHRAIRELDYATTNVSNVEFRHQVKQELRGVQEELADSVDRYRIAHSLWVDLEKNMDAIRLAVNESATTRSLDWAAHFGMIRFSIPRKHYQNINRLCAALLHESPAVRKQARGQVVSAFYHVYTGKYDPAEVFTAASILWIAGLDREISTMLASRRRDSHISITLIFAAALIRSRKHRRVSRGIRVLEQIESLIVASSKPHPDALIGAAYLNFHVWQNSGSVPFWRTDGISSTTAVGVGSVTDPHIVRAIRFARTAYESFSKIGSISSDDPRRIYALNQWVYYMVEGGDPSYHAQIISAARALANYKESFSQHWQYRYDGTLARFFHRLSNTSSEAIERKKLIEMARKHSENASKMAHGDREIERYRTILEVDAAIIAGESST